MTGDYLRIRRNFLEQQKFANKDLFNKCDQIRRKMQETGELVTFTEQFLNEKTSFLVQHKSTKITYIYIKKYFKIIISKIFSRTSFSVRKNQPYNSNLTYTDMKTVHPTYETSHYFEILSLQNNAQKNR